MHIAKEWKYVLQTAKRNGTEREVKKYEKP